MKVTNVFTKNMEIIFALSYVSMKTTAHIWFKDSCYELCEIIVSQ